MKDEALGTPGNPCKTQIRGGDIRVFEFQAGEEHDRLDQFLALRLPELSRTRIRRAIAEGQALLNGSAAAKGVRLNPGDRVSVTISGSEPSSMTPEPMALEVLYESAELIVVNKPAGLLVHPSHTQKSGTLCNALIHHFIQTGGAVIRPGLLHRLDRGTSGVMVIAKTGRAHRIIARAFHQRRVAKRYLALVCGQVALDSGAIDAPIGRRAEAWPRWGIMDEGRPARTLYRVRQRYPQYTLLELEPQTGRTHQLRIHCAALGHPVVGDTVYGAGQENLPFRLEVRWQLLHASHLAFRHPATGREMAFCAPLPSEWQALLEQLDRR